MLGEYNTMGLADNAKYSPGTARRLRQKLNSLFTKSSHSHSLCEATMNNNNHHIIETDYLCGISHDAKMLLKQKGIYTTENDNSYYISEPAESADPDQVSDVTSVLRGALLAGSGAHRLDLLLPSTLLGRLARDVLRMSCCEPYGVRGCTLVLSLQRGSETVSLGRAECCDDTVSTFELHLTLTADKRRWYSLRDLIAPVLPGCLNESQALEVYISPGYRLAKHKLYRPNH